MQTRTGCVTYHCPRPQKTMQGKINMNQTTTNTGWLKSINMIHTNQPTNHSVFSPVNH